MFLCYHLHIQYAKNRRISAIHLLICFLLHNNENTKFKWYIETEFWEVNTVDCINFATRKCTEIQRSNYGRERTISSLFNYNCSRCQCIFNIECIQCRNYFLSHSLEYHPIIRVTDEYKNEFQITEHICSAPSAFTSIAHMDIIYPLLWVYNRVPRRLMRACWI